MLGRGTFLSSAAVLAVGAAWWVTGQAEGGAPLRLPDLDEITPGRLTVKEVRRGGRVRFRLGFRSGSVNVGRGPLFIKARRSPRSPRVLVAEQVVARADGSTVTYPQVGRLIYQRFPDHKHWHLIGYARYDLLRAADGKRARPDLKQGFCLADSFGVRGIPDPPEPVYDVGHRDTDCGRNRPRDNYLEEGISVGWGDDYDPHLEGQQIDLTGLRPGVYLLVHTTNPDRRLRERRYDNNSASVRLRLSWPGGYAQKPQVTVLARCRARPRCPARPSR